MSSSENTTNAQHNDLSDLWAEIMKLDQDVELRDKLIRNITNVVQGKYYSPEHKLIRIKAYLDSFHNRRRRNTKDEENKRELRYAVSGGLLD